MRILGGEKRHFLISSFSSSVARAVTLKKIRVSSRCFVTAFLNKKKSFWKKKTKKYLDPTNKKNTPWTHKKKSFFVCCFFESNRERERSFVHLCVGSQNHAKIFASFLLKFCHVRSILCLLLFFFFFFLMTFIIIIIISITLRTT